MSSAESPLARGFRFRSSLAADAWHPAPEPEAYEWWYFDALSEDGRDALVIIFLANFIFSPRYNRAAAAAYAERGSSASGLGTGAGDRQFPAVAFCLYRDGRPFVRAVTEYSARDFRGDTNRPACQIGGSRFRYDERTKSFILDVRETLRGGRTVEACLSWEMIEGDLSTGNDEKFDASGPSHDWNLVAPRCRVNGETVVREIAGGRVVSSQVFAGCGYHDHNRDRRWPAATIDSWQWGRAHFDGATAVYYHYRERGAPAVAKLFVIRDKIMAEHEAVFTTGRARRDIFGLTYPAGLRIFVPDERITLSVAQGCVVDRSFFYLRFTGEASLELDGLALRAPAITEQLSPRALRWRWLDWLTDMRIGRDGRPAFLK